MHSFLMCKVNRFFFLFLASVALISAGLLVGCQQDQLPTDALSSDLPSIISDGTHGDGNPDFFFLPPLVPDPSGHENWDDRGFNPNYSPEVLICEGWVSCLGMSAFARFTMTMGTGSEVVRLSEEDEHYIVNWHTDDVGDDVVEKKFRIIVLVNEAVVGFADVELASNKDLKQLKNRNTGETIPLKDGRTVPIKFRIEYTLCDPADDECTEQIVSATQDNLIQYGEDNFFLPAQPDGVYYVYDENENIIEVPYLVYSISPCSSGLTGVTVSECLTIEPDKPLAQPLQNPATVSFCELAWDPASLYTVFRRGDDGAERPLPHSEDFCEEEEPHSQAEQTGFLKYARAGLRLLQRPIARLLAPTPLHAKPPVVLHRGKGGLADFTSDFQVLDLGQMDKFPGLLSWWPGDSNFYDIYGESIDPDDPVFVERNDANPVGNVLFAEGIHNEAFDLEWGTEAEGRLEAMAYGLDPDGDGYVSELTVSLWTKLGSLPARSAAMNLVTLLDDATESVPVALGVGGIAGELLFRLETDGGCDGYPCDLVVPNVLQTSCFHHLAATFDGTDMVMYLDGHEVDRQAVDEGSVAVAVPGGSEFRFGPLDGMLDEITVYRAALSGEDIGSIYDAGGEGKCTPPSEYTVSGYVFYSSTPLDGVEVDLIIKGDAGAPPLGQLVETVTTDPYGYYEFSNVAPEVYFVSANGLDNNWIPYISHIVEVVSSDVSVDDLYLVKDVPVVEPKDGVLLNTDLPLFTWEANPETEDFGSYQIRVSHEDSYYPLIVHDEFTTSGYTGQATNSYQVQTPLTRGNGYRWAVLRAFDSDGRWVGMTLRSGHFRVAAVDQENDPAEASTSFGCGNPVDGSLYQSFTPSATTLTGVELRLRAGGSFPQVGINTTVNIRDGTPAGSVLGSATTYVPGPQSGEVLVTLTFAPALTVTVGEPLVIEWLPEIDSYLTWIGSLTGNPYPDGNMYGCWAAPVADGDLNFRTFTP